MMYERSNLDFVRGTFRAKGDVIEVIPAYEKSHGIRIELFGDEIDRIYTFDPLTGVVIQNKKTVTKVYKKVTIVCTFQAIVTMMF